MQKFLDPDRTHDSLFAQRIKGKILYLLKNAISTRGIFDNPFPFCLIERTAPGALTPWADDWTGKMFDFLKPLSRTFILDDGYLNGSAYGFEPEYTAGLPELIDLEEYHLDRLSVRIAPKSDGILTWLERTHDEQSAPYCSKVSNQICIAMRRSKLFRNPTNEAQEFELSTRNWLHNSVCFQSLELVGVTANQAKFLLYDNMQNFLDFLMGELNISSCKVLTGATAKIKGVFNLSQYSPFDANLAGVGEKTFQWENPIFSIVPESFGYAVLEKGGEDSEKLTVIFDKNTEKIEIAVKYCFDSFQAWASTLPNPNPNGFGIEQTPKDYQFFKLLSYTPPINTTAVDFSFSTFKNEVRGYPPLTQNQFLAANSSQGFCDFPLYISKTGEESKNYYFNFVGDEVFGLISRDRIIPASYYWNNYVALTEKILIESTRRNNGDNDIDLVVYDPSAKATGLFCVDINLFKSCEVALMQVDIIDSISIYQKELPPDTTPTPADYINIAKKYARKFAAKIGVNQESLTAQINDYLYIDHTADLLTTDTWALSPEDGLFYPSVDYSTPAEVEVNLPLTRSLRLTNNLEYPDLVVLDPSQSDPANRITIYFGEPGENQLKQILYPDGEDGPPFLDPDPDNGDVMPDSIRIQEIHAALEADKYGVHPDSTEENPKKRLNNLGRLMEGAAYVLGINFNADGENVPYPEPVLFDPEKIEEINSKKILKNAQFAVAEINGAFDTSSLYEVRSPILKGDRKGATIDQRPHAVKYHNLPQLLDVISDDTAKQLGGGKNSIFQVPNANGDDYQQYEGMYQALADALYMLSVHSKSINELQNQSIKTVWMLSQILKALGVPCHVEKVDGVSGLYDEEGNELPGYLAVPGIDAKSPTLVGLLGIVLLNLQRVVGSSIGFRTDETSPEDNAKTTTVSISASPFVINAKDGGNFKFVVKRTTEKEEAKDEKIFINLVINSTLGKDAFEGGFTPGLWSIPLEPGEMSKDFSIEVGQNDDYLENHSITVILSGGEGYSLGANKSATVAILSGQNKEEEKEPEIPDTDWLLEFIAPDKKPDFIPETEEK